MLQSMGSQSVGHDWVTELDWTIDPTRDWPRLACESPGVSCGRMGRQWPIAGSRALNTTVRAQDLLKEVTIIFITQAIVSGQTTGREHIPAHKQKIGLKIYWAWPPSEQGLVSPIVNLFHQEASISFLSLSIRGQTEWKPQSQKLIKLITWTTALSNSMKLWAMPCRTNQDGWVMVESSDKMWSTGQGMANYSSTFALRSPWRVWKGKKIWPHPSLHNFHMKVRPDQGISFISQSPFITFSSLPLLSPCPNFPLHFFSPATRSRPHHW